MREVEMKRILGFLDAELIEYKFRGDKNDKFKGFSTLFNYKEGTMTFISTLYNFKNHKIKFQNKNIQLIITSLEEVDFDCFTNVIQVKKPTNVFFLLIEHFFEKGNEDAEFMDINKFKNIEQNSSYISEKSLVGNNVKIGRGCIIEDGVVIGENTEIHHNVVIRSGTTIGANCTIYSGTVIGERGFNPSTQEDGNRRMLKHFGGVIIENNVHIGVNCSIHRGSIDDTIIKSGVKLNTMVHVAHNCVIGKNTVVTMPTQICGSVQIGEGCHIAATTIRNQCNVGDGATLGLGSVVVKDVAPGETVVGNPAKPLKKR